MIFCRLFVALASATAFLFPPEVEAQAKPAGASTYTVVKGDDVVSIARKLRYPKATESQMYYAIVKANINAFSTTTVERLTPGTRLTIPGEAAVLATDVTTADAYMASLRKAEVLYQKGIAAEQAGDMKTALENYLESAKIGHALADLKLGQLYDKGLTKTLPRDLQESIVHYQNARQRGVEVKGPTNRAPQLDK